MKINLKTVDGDQFSLNIEPICNILDLKKAISFIKHTEPQYQTLMHQGKILSQADTSSLKQLSIHTNDTLTLFIQENPQLSNNQKVYLKSNRAKPQPLNQIPTYQLEDYTQSIILLEKGYPDEMFLSPSMSTLEHLRCGICHQIFNNPFQDNHGHNFCFDCFRQCIEKYERCPLNLDDKIQLKDINNKQNLILRKILDEAIVVCFKQSQGCGWNGKLQQLKGHVLEECIYHLAKCQNQFCDFVTQRDFMHIHNEICPERSLTCTCGKVMAAKQLPKHKILQCELRWVHCAFCGQEEKFQDLEKHSIDCQSQVILCPICQFQLQKKDLQQHNQMEAQKHMGIMQEKLHRLEKKLQQKNEMLQKKDLEILALQDRLQNCEVLENKQNSKKKCHECKNNGCTFHKKFHSCTEYNCPGIPNCKICYSLRHKIKSTSVCVECQVCKGEGYV